MLGRGQIHTHKRAGQLRDYSGLLYGSITPTDIDGLMDFRDTYWVIFELKVVGQALTGGQRLALQRLCTDLARVKPAYALVAEHSTRAQHMINAAACTVVEYHNGLQWLKPRRPISLKQAIDALDARHGRKGIA